MYVAERNFKSEQVVKAKIMDGRDRGVCDRYGHTIPRHKRSYGGKKDRYRPVNKALYDANYIRIFGHE